MIRYLKTIKMILPLLLAAFIFTGSAVAKPAGRSQARFVEDEIIVMFRPGVSAEIMRSINARHGAAVRRSSRKLGFLILKIPEGADVEDIVEKFSAEPAVLYAEPNYIAHALLTPDDPGLSYQWGLNNIGQTMGTPDADIDAPEGWDVETGSSSVIIAILDTGVAFRHPDLVNKLWINSGEIPDNVIDDDGNGYVDDYRGWNADGDNNNIDDFHGHGTYCAGIAAADTNNAAGIAGVAWNNIVMPVQVLNSDGYGTYEGIADGIAYAVDNGAHIISMSLGGFNSSTTMEMAMQYAYNAGLTLVCAAGNEYGPPVLYPGAYDQYCLTVSATDHNDLIAPFSSTGPEVDVAAPGDEIYSSSRYVNEWTETHRFTYNVNHGTSAATPFVSGLAGLIISQYPAYTNEEVMDRIKYTTDDVNSSEYDGKDNFLGYGRINAYEALTASPHPLISYEEHAVDDPQGNNDGFADPGETVDMIVTLKNSWADALEVSATLSTSDQYVSITSGTSSFGNIAAGSAADNSTNPYTLTVAPDCPMGHRVAFTLDITASAYSKVSNFKIVVGRPDILFVDDDGGVHNYELAYTRALDALELAYDVWEVPFDEDGPTYTDMAQYDIVIWDALTATKPLGGGVTQIGYSLTSLDVQELSAYLNAGGKLFMTSSNLKEHPFPPPELDPFINNYLHTSTASRWSAVSVAGVFGDLFDGIELNLLNENACELTPDGASQKLFTVSDPESYIYGSPSALRYPSSGSSTYRVVFLGFDLHHVQSPDGRAFIISQAVNWLRDMVPPPATNLAPAAEAGNDKWAMEGESVLFDGTASHDPDGTIKSYEWKEGEDILSKKASFSKSLSAGAHFIALTVTDDGEVSDTDYVTVYVQPTFISNTGPDIPPAPTGPTVIAPNTPYVYTASTTDPEGDQIYYEFNWGDAFLGYGTYTTTILLYDSGVPVGIPHTFASEGTYEISVRAFDYYGDALNGLPCWSEPLTVTVSGPDTTPPVISLVASSNVTSSSAVITWITDEPSDSVVNYGPTTALGSTESDPGLVTSHSITLAGLSPETTYYYEVQSTDVWGNTATDDNGGLFYSFTTTSEGETMHVDSIDMALNQSGRRISALATVTVVDADGFAVEGAQVFGHWENATTDSDSGFTNAYGEVTLESDKLRNPPSGTTFTFVVDDIVLSGWTYDPAANMETSDSITVN